VGKLFADGDFESKNVSEEVGLSFEGQPFGRGIRDILELEDKLAFVDRNGEVADTIGVRPLKRISYPQERSQFTHSNSFLMGEGAIELVGELGRRHAVITCHQGHKSSFPFGKPENFGIENEIL
jgi:hypothetical protein